MRVSLLLSILVLSSTASSATAQERGPGGVVAAGTPEAARVGAAILAAGGNAADAAVAVAFALGVTEPADSGLGGQACAVLQVPSESPVVVLGCSCAPGAIPAMSVVREKKLVRDHRATTVPTFVRTMEVIWSRYGSGKMKWSQLVEPAAELAATGFRLGPHRYAVTKRNADFLRKRPSAAAVFLDDGRLPSADAVLRQPALARTLRRLAEAGAADFYTGDIARAIADDMKRNGGWITLDDLRRVPPPPIVAPLHATYRGFDVYTLPPPGAGWVLLQALNILERAPQKQLSIGEPARAIWIAEALRAATRNRRESPVPNPRSYAGAIQEKISKARADELREGFDAPAGGETTHFSVVDANGMVVSVTQSLNTFYGAKVLTPELGFLYNNYMQEFTTRKPRHPYALKPNALSYSSMAATVVSRDGRPVLALGSPGGGRIVSSVLQVVSGWIDDGQRIDHAVAASRIHYVAKDNGLRLERYPDDRDLILALQRRRFSLWVPVTTFRVGERDAYFGGVHAVAFERGGWRGAADPRRDGRAIASEPDAR